MSETPQIEHKATRPPGIVPRNLQTWIVAGVAILMVVVISLSGKNPPKRKEVAIPPAPVIDPNAARIQEYRARVDEQVRRLEQEQAQLAAAKRLRANAAPGTGYQAPDPSAPATFRYQEAASPTPEETWLRAEKVKRDYESLFTSNIALSLRKDPGSGRGALPEPKGIEAPPRGTDIAGDKPVSTTAKTRAEGAAQPDTKKYRLFEGTVIETVLTNRLDGSFSGPVNCMATTSVYSHDGQRLLIPQGSRLLGEVKPVDKMGQERLAMTFHRLIMPDGYSVSLDQFKGLDQIGETGLRDQVNHHYMQIFGASIAIGAIAGLSQANTRYGFDQSALDAYRQGVATSLSQSSLHILDRYLNVFPTFTIREGQRVKVILATDLELPAFDKHQMPVDL